VESPAAGAAVSVDSVVLGFAPFFFAASAVEETVTRAVASASDAAKLMRVDSGRKRKRGFMAILMAKEARQTARGGTPAMLH
jgi:hypothetical protein